jgi:acyl CoA:acetate/3-ketoacid CoA transferase beta subunit
MHQRRKFVPRLQYLTSPGYLDGGDARRRVGLQGGGPSRVITDLGVLGFDPVSKRMRLESLHPGVTLDEVKEQTGFELLIPASLLQTELPTLEQIRLLRERIDPEGEYLTPPQPGGRQAG